MNQGKLVKASIDKDYTQKVSIYFPKQSYGWISLMVLAVIFGTLAYLALQAYRLTGDLGAIFTLVVSIGLLIDFLVLTVWFFSMRYELSSESLVIKMGPLQYVIDLDAIKIVTAKDLTNSWWPGLKLPGFSLFYSYYKDEGRVFMCATRSQKEVILIETETRKFGITPDKDELFLAEINSYLKGKKIYKDLNVYKKN